MPAHHTEPRTPGTSEDVVRRSAAQPTEWTRPLQVLTAVCSVVFAIGSAVQNFVIVTPDMLEHTMRLAGLSAAEAAASGPGWLTGFRTVGTLFIVGNALGILALRGWAWVFWLAIAINFGQAAGIVMIPPEVWRASIDLYGPAGVLPSAITDGGGLLLALVLIGSFIRFRTPWARRRT